MNSLNITLQTPLSRTCESYEVIFFFNNNNSYIFLLKNVALFLNLISKNA